MEIYIRSRGENPNNDYKWLDQNHNIVEEPDLLIEYKNLIYPESESILLIRKSPQLLLRITALPSSRYDYQNRLITNEIAWIGDESDEPKFRAIAVSILKNSPSGTESLSAGDIPFWLIRFWRWMSFLRWTVESGSYSLMRYAFSQIRCPCPLQVQIDFAIEENENSDLIVSFEALDVEVLKLEPVDSNSNNQAHQKNQIAPLNENYKNQLIDELKKNSLPVGDGALVVVTKIKSLDPAQVWRGLSDQVESQLSYDRSNSTNTQKKN